MTIGHLKGDNYNKSRTQIKHKQKELRIQLRHNTLYRYRKIFHFLISFFSFLKITLKNKKQKNFFVFSLSCILSLLIMPHLKKKKKFNHVKNYCQRPGQPCDVLVCGFHWHQGAPRQVPTPCPLTLAEAGSPLICHCWPLRAFEVKVTTGNTHFNGGDLDNNRLLCQQVQVKEMTEESTFIRTIHHTICLTAQLHISIWTCQSHTAV